jgi:transcriptional regulator with XRE-family HTH domain
MTSRLFPALLRYWRGRRGLSQLELALEAEVSARHVSFLESGRTRPSSGMLLRLFAVLDVPPRDQNEALRAAGLEPYFPEPSLDALPPEVERALSQMLAQHEPFPLVVLSLESTILRSSQGATALFGAFVAEPEALPAKLDMVALLFDPRLLRPFVVEWPALARSMLSRIHRENLQRGGDERLTALLERAFSFPDVPRAWRLPDFSVEAQPTLILRLERGGLRVAFLVTVTVFSAPQQIAFDELRIESCFPLDEETRAACIRLAGRA